MTKAKRKPFTVGLCGVCDQYAVCAALTPSVRYCRTCVKETLGWIQITAGQQAKFTEAFDALEANAGVKKLLARLATVSDEDRKAIAIGESRRRLHMEER